MSTPSPIRFYFDYISSNAYLAWHCLPPLAARAGRRIEAIPTLFAGYLEAYGQLGPAEVRPKAFWMAKNNLRKAKLLGLTLRPPLFHPFNPLPSLRVSSLDLPDDARARLVTALFRAQWTEQRNLGSADVVAAIASEVGLDGAALVAAAQEPAIKARLRAQTDAAIAAGAFGVPTVVVDDELFWGYDDFAFLASFLEGRDPLDRAELATWIRPQRAGAMRRQHRERAGVQTSHLIPPDRDPKT